MSRERYSSRSRAHSVVDREDDPGEATHQLKLASRPHHPRRTRTTQDAILARSLFPRSTTTPLMIKDALRYLHCYTRARRVSAWLKRAGE